MRTSQSFQTGLGVISKVDISSDSAGCLRSVIDKIHTARDIDEIMFEINQDICEAFNADRLTIYSVSSDRTSLISRVKTGLDSCQDLTLPINEQSVAGFVALHRKIVNFADVYDRNELGRQGVLAFSARSG